MADISTFPTIHQVLWNDGPVRTFTAGEAITAGQLVGYAATGVSDTVVGMDKTAGEQPVGVALTGAANGAPVAVCMDGCEVEMAVADDTTGIDAGNAVEWNDNAVKGTVSEYTPRADLASTVIDGADDTTIDGSTWVIGQAMEDIAGGGTGKVRLKIRQELYTDHAVV
jgi:hypothetical protein